MSNLLTVVTRRSLGRVVGVFLTLALNVGVVQAQMDAYSVRVAATDRSEKEQQDAFQVGMRSVLLANSGDKTLLNRDDVRAGLQQAGSYVGSFRYESPAPGTVIPRSTPVTDTVRTTGKATQIMMIQFNRSLINELIRPSSANQSDAAPVEGADPFMGVSSALMWLIVEDGGRQTLISGASGQNVMERAREIAGGSGLSLSFPAGDNSDLQAVSIEDIKTAAVDKVTAAAARYAQPLTMAAHITRTRTGSWESVWLKVAAGQQQNLASTNGSLDEALQKGIAWLNSSANASLSGGQANRQSNTSSPEGLVWFSPLRTTQSYAQVVSFLSSVPGVSVAYPKEVLSGGMVFAIMPRSALPEVTRAASTRNWLRQSAMPSAANESRFAAGVSAAFEYLR